MLSSTFQTQTRAFGLLVFVLVIGSCIVVQAKRKDTVIMKNGDHLTGEVKKLENGVLYVDLHYVSGSVGLNWLEVDQVQSSGGFQVVFRDGGRVAGAIEKKSGGETPGKDFEVRTQSGVVESTAPEVVNIESQKSNFWRQITGSIDFGYSFTSGNSQTQANADASANYLSTRWMAGVSLTSSFSGQPHSSQTNLVDVQTLDGFFLSRNSFLTGLGDFLHSSQQDLALRTTLGGGYGRYFIRSNQALLRWLAGAVYTHENFTSTGNHPAAQNVEGLLGVQYDLFHFDRYSLQSQLLIYPGFSDVGRVRTTTKTTFTVKLTNNFHTDLSFWDNFDSRPPNAAKKNELGVSNSLGWTF